MPTTRPSLIHHPVVAVSLLLMVAAGAQIAVWSLQGVFSTAVSPASKVVLHGWLFEQHEQFIAHHIHEEDRVRAALFLTGLAAGLVAGLAWYLAARLVHRPIAAWVVGIIWFAHPGVVLLIQRDSALMLMVAPAALFWMLLVAWHRTRHYASAMATGVAAGAMTLMSLLGAAFLIVAAAGMMLSGGGRRRHAIAAGELLLGWAIVVIPAWYLMQHDNDFDPFVQKLRSDLWTQLDSGEKTAIAQDALQWRSSHPAESHPRSFVFLAHELMTRPRILFQWIGQRAWRTLYATGDGSFARPMLATQMAVLIPAIWAVLISLARPGGRWLTFTGLGLALVTWLAAALAQPLARNLLPACGIMLLLACIGLADGRERLLRLTDRISASHISSRKRVPTQAK